MIIQKSAAVMLDIENVKQYQRTARQLRAFETKQLKQLLRIKCKKNHASVRLHEATRTGLIGLAGMTKSEWLSRCSISEIQ